MKWFFRAVETLLDLENTQESVAGKEYYNWGQHYMHKIEITLRWNWNESDRAVVFQIFLEVSVYIDVVFASRIQCYYVL